MEIVTLSDTHSHEDEIKVPDGDVVVHAGDCSPRGSIKDIGNFAKWYGNLPHKHKIMIAGNHDFSFQEYPDITEKIIKDNGIIYLKDSEVIIDGTKFYGSPWQPWFGGWAFNIAHPKALKEKWDMIPKDTDILITHGPPFGILDVCLNNQKSAGCKELLKAVKRVRPKIHVFGHIHEGYGRMSENNTIFVNASICTLWYEPKNKPMIFSIY